MSSSTPRALAHHCGLRQILRFKWCRHQKRPNDVHAVIAPNRRNQARLRLSVPEARLTLLLEWLTNFGGRLIWCVEKFRRRLRAALRPCLRLFRTPMPLRRLGATRAPCGGPEFVAAAVPAFDPWSSILQAHGKRTPISARSSAEAVPEVISARDVADNAAPLRNVPSPLAPAAIASL